MNSFAQAVKRVLDAALDPNFDIEDICMHFKYEASSTEDEPICGCTQTAGLKNNALTHCDRICSFG